MPAYIPPSKRPGFQPRPNDPSSWSRESSKPKVKTIEDHFQQVSSIFSTVQQGTFNYFSYPHTGTYVEEQGLEHAPKKEKKIYPPHPLSHLIAYIMLFPRAQPLWESGGEIWSHTGSEVIVNDWKREKVNFGRPIPVFQWGSSKQDRFTFIGWWQMNALRVVEPESPELVDLLETKERSRTYSGGRTKEAWAASLQEKWVKTRFTPVPDSHERYSELVNPTTLGVGEGAKLVLSVGGFEEELKVLEGLASEKKDKSAVPESETEAEASGQLDMK